MSTSAEIEVEREGAVLICRIAGEIDMNNAAFLREELTGAVPNDAEALAVDLAAVRYLDSSAIELLFELARRLARRRQRLHLIVPERSPLRRLLELTDIASVAVVETGPAAPGA